MKRLTVLLTILFLVTGCQAQTGTSYSGSIRQPVRAGQFYPAEKDKLESAVRSYLEHALPASGSTPVGIIVPHAGYVYSAQIAADAFKQAAEHDYDIIVILGTNHTSGSFRGVSIYNGSGFETPLGIAPVDRQLATDLSEADERFKLDATLHTDEHSIEVELPFIQALFPDTPILPVVISGPDWDLCRDFGEALVTTLKDRKPLLVASTDLSHYPNYEDALRVDHGLMEAVATFSPEKVRETIRNQMRLGLPALSTCACGEGPILATMIASKALGAKHAVPISYANSGDAAVGDHNRVVGYMAVGFFNDDPGINWKDSYEKAHTETDPQSLSEDGKKELLQLARTTLEQVFQSDTYPLPRSNNPELNRLQGAFVTLNKNHQLRGCIGHMAEDLPLVQTVSTMALQAAFSDRRFSQLRQDELDDIEIEISVLTPYTRVEGPESIVIGRDGVLIRDGRSSAVYLPQVAPEQGWNVDETLDHLCRKAGLSQNTWRTSKTMEFYTFQAIVFSESDIDRNRQ